MKHLDIREQLALKFKAEIEKELSKLELKAIKLSGKKTFNFGDDDDLWKLIGELQDMKDQF